MILFFRMFPSEKPLSSSEQITQIFDLRSRGQCQSNYMFFHERTNKKLITPLSASSYEWRKKRVAVFNEKWLLLDGRIRSLFTVSVSEPLTWLVFVICTNEIRKGWRGYFFWYKSINVDHAELPPAQWSVFCLTWLRPFRLITTSYMFCIWK